MADPKESERQSSWGSTLRSWGGGVARRVRDRNLGTARRPASNRVRAATPQRPDGPVRPKGRAKLPSGPRLRRALRDIERLRSRVAQLERDIQESRQLNKRLAEVTDAVAEVLLPVQSRDETRLRTLLREYDDGL